MLSLELDTAVCTDVLTDIVSPVQSLRSSVAASLRQLLEDDSEHLSTVLELAKSLYEEKLYVSHPCGNTLHIYYCIIATEFME